MLDTFYDGHTLVFFFLFCLWYLMVHSDVMIEQVISKVPGSISGNVPTTKGTLIQMAAMVIGYIILMMFVSAVL